MTRLQRYYDITQAWSWPCLNDARRLLMMLRDGIQTGASCDTPGKLFIDRALRHLAAEDEIRLRIQCGF